MDPYMRARTVRIGKWRWPPPKTDMDSAAGVANHAKEGPTQGDEEGFLEFMMRKMQERRAKEKKGGNAEGGQGPDSLNTSGEIQARTIK